MTREELQKIEDIIFRHMHDKGEAARTVLEIRQTVGRRMDASRPEIACCKPTGAGQSITGVSDAFRRFGSYYDRMS